MESKLQKMSIKSSLHKISILLFFLYVVSVYICSFLVELNIISLAIFAMFFGTTAFYIAIRGYLIISKGIYFHFLFLFLVILSYYWIMIDYTSSQRISTLLLLILLAVIIINVIIDEKSFHFSIKMLYFAGIAMCIYSFLFYGYEGTLQALSENQDIRLGQEINEANIFGMICAFTVIIGLYYGFYEKKKFYLFSSLIPIIFSLTSGSRMSILIIVAAALIMIIMKKGKNIISTFFMWVLSALIIIILLNFLSESNLFIFKRFELFFNIFNDDMAGADGSSVTRLNMMKDGIKWFLQKPIFGYGTDQYGILYYQNYGTYRYSHSNVIEVLVNHGVVGFAIYYGLYLYIAIYIVKAVKRNLPYSILMLALLGGMIVANIFFVMLYLKPTYIIIGVFLSYITVNKNTLKSRFNIMKEGARQ